MSFAKHIGDVIAKDKEIDATLSWHKRREHILLQLRAVVAFSAKGAGMPSVPTPETLGPAPDPKCKTPACGRPRAMNIKTGQCLWCYSKAKAMVASGKTTWEKLAELGLTIGASEATDPFTKAFNAANKE